MDKISEKAYWPGWETVRVIGRGSFGAVYEIERKFFDETEKAALKVISIPQNSNDIEELRSDGYDEESITNTFKDHLKNIASEYSLMRKLNGCTNVVNCDDMRYVQQDNGYGWDIYIKMELLTPLTKALPSQIPEGMVVKAAKDLCCALDLCKRYNIIHRDIKPQNIFVSDNGDYKLGDFGIAKTVEKTSGGTRIGTYKYIAPEVFYNKPYGSTADIYSLGLTLYWMLNERRMPFLPLPPVNLTPMMDEQARMRRLSGEKIPVPAHGSPELKAIVLKACETDVDRRYQSAREMLDDLNRLMMTQKMRQFSQWQAPGYVAQPEVPARKIPVFDAVEPICEETVVMKDGAELYDEGTALLDERAELYDEGTALLGEQTALLDEGTALLDESTALLEETVYSPQRTTTNTGFSSANEMLEALGLSGMKSQPTKSSSTKSPKLSVGRTMREQKLERNPSSAQMNTGFSSADEMFAALGLAVPKKSAAPVKEPKKWTPTSNNGFSSANEMLESLGIDSKTMKKK